jgi:hypothetical protein
MTKEQLEAIRRRCEWIDKHYDEFQYTGNEDRRDLLAEVDRLTKASLAAESTYMEMVEDITRLRGALERLAYNGKEQQVFPSECRYVAQKALESRP